MKMQLSKSDYLLYLKQPAWLWLKKHDPKKLPQVDEATQAIFDAGFLFESYAEKLFPDGIKLNWEGYKEYIDLPKRTNEAILSGARTIFQPRFEINGITCISDIIVFINKKYIDLYEIKSSTSPKPYHEHDLAFQTIVLEDSGYKVRNIAIIHVNKNYIRRGDIDAKQITEIADVTEKVKKRLASTRSNIKKALKVVEQKEMPNPSPSLCQLNCTIDWLEIYKGIMGIKPGDGSIYDLYSPSATLIGKLEDEKIENIKDIPVDFLGLSDKQKWQLKALKANKRYLDKNRLSDFLGKINYPLYFLDYETLAGLIPYFDGHRPFQQVPFQYSLHVLDKPGGPLSHFEYLHKKNTDPINDLSRSLRKHIGDNGSVLVWYEPFEKTRNEEMGSMLPEFKDFYEKVNSRVIDLMTPFYNFYYVDPRFGGSASLKSILPVLVPELSHKDLDISEGGMAQRLWMDAILEDKKPLEKEKILKDLLDYCKLDTFAMVKILEFLNKL